MTGRFAPVVWDVDGTLVDSTSCSWLVAELVLEVATGHRPQIRNASDEHRLFGSSTLAESLPGQGDTLRSMHRIGMRARAGTVRLFPGIESVVRAVRVPQLVVTAALTDYAREALGPLSDCFVSIRGHDNGSKRDLLHGLIGRSRGVYIGDSIRDVEICRAVGMPVIAVSWGLDGPAALRNAAPDHVVHSPDELARLLAT